MIKVIDIVYYSHTDITDPFWSEASPSLGFADFLRNEIRMEFIMHMNMKALKDQREIIYFFQGRNRFWHIPFKTLDYKKSKAGYRN
jgi:hypothetical protein